MKIIRTSSFVIFLAIIVIVCGCVPFKPRTLWFKADPIKEAGSPRNFYMEIAEGNVEAGRDNDEAKRQAYLLKMAEFWSRKQEQLCHHGVVPKDYGYNAKKRRYWIRAECKQEI